MGILLVTAARAIPQIVMESYRLSVPYSVNIQSPKGSEWKGWEERRWYSSFGIAVAAVNLDVSELDEKSYLLCMVFHPRI